VKLQILHLEDNPDDVELIRHNLARGGLDFELHAVESASDYLAALDEKRFDVILSDSGLPGYDSRAALMAAQARSPETPFVVVSASNSPLPGSAAFISKTDVTQLANVIQRTCESAALEVQPDRADIVRVLQAELKQRTAELAVVNRELEAFSYSVAHDLRSPLITIDGFCQILQETAAPRLTEDDRSHLERIDQAVIRMRRLIEDLMGLAKIVRAPMQRVPVDLTMIATEITDELRASGAPRSADIIIAPRLLTEGDQALLRVVLANLLGNAWKFTSRKAHARIELGVRLDAERNEVYFVRDNGAGFDPGFADRLFSPFSRCHSQQEFPGTGIGLAAVQRVIHRHGGAVWAESQPDRGATFYFTLPRA
jgi:light-regulated signal transduction histidine kinase (bacteriophytochrome)/CheY-like chemotaxis protein